MDLGEPGKYPYTRGPYKNMYRGRLWTMRQFAGFGTASQTNERYKFLLEHGQTGLSVAFSLHTIYGFEADSEKALGEVGKEGVSIDTLKDMETLFDGIDLSKISNKTKMLVIVGEDDDVVGNYSAKIIFNNTNKIPLSNKDFVIQVTDKYGNPDILADHMAPVCFPKFLSDTTDAMDYYSTWKLFDALTDYAFYGKNKEYCLGDTPEQRFMGLWSDGTPVKELLITDNP